MLFICMKGNFLTSVVVQASKVTYFKLKKNQKFSKGLGISGVPEAFYRIHTVDRVLNYSCGG